MNEFRIIKAYIGTGTYSTTEPIMQGDYGYILQIEGTELPATYRVDFSNDRHKGEALPVYGNENGAEVPEELIATGKDIFAFYYYIGENFGKTAYTWKIPNDTRAQNGDREPTPTQQDSIDQLIVRSNEAVEVAEQKASEADISAQSALNSAIEANRAELSAKYHALNAEQSSINADLSANDASSSAEASAQSANQAEAARQEATSLVSEAQRYVNASEQSATASANSATSAQGYAQSASASAQSASGYATQADTSANTASIKASEASQSATTASNKATESAQSATNASQSAQAAESAKTASQTAQGLAESARDSAVSAKTDAESARDDAESARNEAVSAVESISGALDDKAPVITDTASGTIASFPDGADGIPLKSLVVDINPIQDLSHGDPSPENICPISGHDSVSVWDDPVYGGTIRWNQLLSENQAVESYSKFGLTFAMISGKMGFNVTGTFNFEGADRNAYIYRQNYTIAIIKDHVYCIAYVSKYATVYCYGAQFSGNWTGHAPHGGSIIKATNSAYLNLSLNFGQNIPNGTVFNEEILINLFDLTEMFGEEKADEIYALDMQSPRGQGVTWFKALFPNNYYEPDDSYTETCVSAVNGDLYRQIEVEYPTEAGTVYGGTLDVLSGELTVDRVKATFTKDVLSSTWYTHDADYSTWGFYANYDDKWRNYIGYMPTGGLISDKFRTVSSAYGVDDTCCSVALSNVVMRYMAFRIPKTAIDTPTDAADLFNKIADWLDSNPIEICFNVAETTIQLTPHEVRSLLGDNNVWADSGDTVVEYRADPTLYINKKITEAISALS